jgi:glutathione peroxidase
MHLSQMCGSAAARVANAGIALVVLATAGTVAISMASRAEASSGAVPAPPSGDAFTFAFAAIEGHDLPLAQFRGRPMLVVNTASFCGFTHQYAELQALWESYRDRGLVVLGVPSDDFNQELDDNTAIQEFCEVEFGIDFPMTERVAVRGTESHPLFAYFREELGASAGPNWNFFKYLVAADGRVVEAWSSRTAPNSTAITSAIERALEADS